ncbi:unnamed protein product [Blumeria hordei]|uniref:F-box domain-containing protein n=1 Tax=Blumeria hordei TaxID=2867405 RepID=A0A383ULN5_BLUHO|nr:unnamed protein product [Blumeria hordei]
MHRSAKLFIVVKFVVEPTFFKSNNQTSVDAIIPNRARRIYLKHPIMALERLGKFFKTNFGKMNLSRFESDWLPSKFQQCQNIYRNRSMSNYSNISPFDTCRGYAFSDSGTLGNLPPELISEIASKLPTSSAVALSLCSKYLYKTLGPQYIVKINKETPKLEELIRQASVRSNPVFLYARFSQRLVLLSLLDRDTTDIILCYFCHKLHKPLSTPFYVDKTSKKYPCTYASHGNRSCNIIFNTSQVRMAMKLFHRSLDPSKYLEVLSESTLSLRHNSNTISFPRIIGRRLFIKVLHTYTVPFEKVVLHWNNGSNFAYPKLPNWSATGHLVRCSESELNIQAQTLVRQARETSNAILKSDLERCPVCLVEYEIRVPRITSKSADVECISWHDLGEGNLPFWNPILMSRINFLIGDIELPKLGTIKNIFENS